MSPQWTQELKHLIWGHRLESANSEAIVFHAILCDLRPRFIPKGRVGRSFRAISRNGRILLISRIPLDELLGREVVIRLQPWRKVILIGDKPVLFGILMCVQDSYTASPLDPMTTEILQARPLDSPLAPGEIVMDVGGRSILVLERWLH
jgi:hypothetical protein